MKRQYSVLSVLLLEAGRLGHAIRASRPMVRILIMTEAITVTTTITVTLKKVAITMNAVTLPTTTSRVARRSTSI